jgi:hypothetical protein
MRVKRSTRKQGKHGRGNPLAHAFKDESTRTHLCNDPTTTQALHRHIDLSPARRAGRGSDCPHTTTLACVVNFEMSRNDPQKPQIKNPSKKQSVQKKKVETLLFFLALFAHKPPVSMPAHSRSLSRGTAIMT